MTDRRRRMKRLSVLLGLLLVACQAAADVKGRVRLSLDGEAQAWLGQQVQVNLDLESTGFSFADIHFNLPEVVGAIFMQTDTTTVKLSENRNGEAWQIIRYPLVLYPQKTGVVTIPPLAVRFSSTAGFGTEPRRFDLRTGSVTVSVRRPPGTQPGAAVVSTPDFQLRFSRKPDTTELTVGSALQLSVTRSAQGVSGMFLEPIPLPEFEGVSAYPGTPRIDDRVDRGSLTGERIDTVTWVFEQPGRYLFPENAFPWWDPRSGQLRQRVVPALTVEVTSLQQTGAGADPAATPTGRPGLLGGIAGVIVLLVLVAWALARAWRRRQTEGKVTDPFDDLLLACRNDAASEAYRALSAWAAASGPRSPTWTASDLARHSQIQAFAAAVEELQTGLVTAAGDWHGESLAAAARAARGRPGAGGSAHRRYDLPELNPGC